MGGQMGADKAALWVGVVAIVVSILIPLGTQTVTGHIPRWLLSSAAALTAIGAIFAYLGTVGPPPVVSQAAGPTPAPRPTTTTEPATSPTSIPAPTTSGPSTTLVRSVTISAVHKGPRHVTVNLDVSRPPRQGYVYWFVLEVHEVSGTHSEWYPRNEITSTARLPMTIPDDADITRPRTGAVYEVLATVGEYYRTGRPDPSNSNDFLL